MLIRALGHANPRLKGASAEKAVPFRSPHGAANTVFDEQLWCSKPLLILEVIADHWFAGAQGEPGRGFEIGANGRHADNALMELQSSETDLASERDCRFELLLFGLQSEPTSATTRAKMILVRPQSD